MTVGAVSGSQERFYPPSLTPSFMGPHPPEKFDVSVHDATGINYFQKYRIETLSKFSMPRYEWGMQGSRYSPEPNIDAARMLRNINRDLIVVSNDISTIDLARMREVDDLYKGVQINRSQYKDRTGTFHPLTYFQPNCYKYQCAPGMTTSYLEKYPQNYVGYKTPIVLPARQKEIPNIPNLSLTGIYNKTSCIAYKR